MGKKSKRDRERKLKGGGRRGENRAGGRKRKKAREKV